MMHRQHSPVSRSARPSAMAWGYAVAGLALLVLAAARMDWVSWGAVGIMSALGLATSLFSFPIDDRTSVTLGPAVFIGSVALFGVQVAVLVTAFSILLLEVLRFRSAGLRPLARVGIQIIAVFAASVCYMALGGRVAPHGLTIVDGGRFLAMFISYAAVSGVFSASIEKEQRGGFARYTRWLSGRGVIVELAMLPLAMLLVASYIPSEPATFPLLAVVLVISSAAGQKLWDTQQKLLERVSELKTLNAVGDALTSSLRLDDLVRLIHLQTRELLEAPVMAVAVSDETTGEVEFRACVGDDCEIASWRVRPEDSFTGVVAQTREILYIPDLEKETERRITPKLAEYARARGVEARSWLGIPLIAGERLVGVLSVQSSAPRAFGENRQQLLETIGSHVGKVVDNARLYEQIERSKRSAEEWNKKLEQRVTERTSELQKAREELEILNRELEERVEKRTRQLKDMQVRIVQSGRLAAVGELAAGVAHELNNPLGGILGYAQYDLERLASAGERPLSEPDVEKLKHHMTFIEREGQRCREIVENLLRFSETSRRAKTDVKIREVLKETLAFTERDLSNRGIEIAAELDESDATVQGDPRQIQQVFANIILNAKKAMPSGGKLSVRTTRIEEKDDGSGLIAVSFGDTGCGIPEENLVRVFEPFFTTSDVGEGAGLGLSVSYGIVKDHGGEIDVESKVGAGSVFTVKLPIAAGSGGGALTQGSAQ